MSIYFIPELLLALLLFVNIGMFIVFLIIGGAIMDSINAAIANLNVQVKVLGDYVFTLKGQTISSEALSAAADSINQASAALEALTK